MQARYIITHLCSAAVVVFVSLFVRCRVVRHAQAQIVSLFQTDYAPITGREIKDRRARLARSKTFIHDPKLVLCMYMFPILFLANVLLACATSCGPQYFV